MSRGAARGGHEAPGPGEAAERGPRQVDLGADFPQPLEREIESTLAYPILSGKKRTEGREERSLHFFQASGMFSLRMFSFRFG